MTAISLAKYAVDSVFDRLDANDRQVRGFTVTQERDPTGDGFMIVTIEPLTKEIP